MRRDDLIEILREEFAHLAWLQGHEILRFVARNEHNDISPTLVEMAQRQIERDRETARKNREAGY